MDNEAKPVAKAKKTDYENIEADCPSCGQECNFNRASELCTLAPVPGKDVTCAKCKRDFRLTGDSANERHEMLIYDCHELLERKRYMYCIINLCQAYEMFFSLFLRVKLLYEPFGYSLNRGSNTLKFMNELRHDLETKIGRFTFEKMRSVFLRLVIESNPPATLHEAEKYISELSPMLPKDSELKSVKDRTLMDYLMRVKGTDINGLRNRVVHKAGYRPTREEAEKELQEAGSVLFPLTRRLNLRDDVNLYMR